MKRSLYLPGIVLSMLFLTLVIAPASAAPTAAPTATVPPILQACSHAMYPVAGFACNFTGNDSVIPDGPPYTLRCLDNSSSDSNQTIVSWKWDFGDGGSSTDKNPLHTYSDAGTYDVRHTVTTFCGQQYSNTSFEMISIYCSVPQPSFSTNVTEGYAPLAVQVIDGSLHSREDVTRWTYWFDNTHSSTEKNPVFTYTTPGTYLINQTVWKDCIQLGSTLYPPATRQIRVNPPFNGTLPANGTPGPAAATPAGTPMETATTVVAAPVVTGSPEPTPATGSLSMNTEPSGVQITIDGVFRGSTPVTIDGLTTGSHTVLLERDGYNNMTLPVSVSGGKTTSISTSLIPVSGGIALLPVIALSVIILGVLAGGIYLYLWKRYQAMNEE